MWPLKWRCHQSLKQLPTGQACSRENLSGWIRKCHVYLSRLLLPFVSLYVCPPTSSCSLSESFCHILFLFPFISFYVCLWRPAAEKFTVLTRSFFIHTNNMIPGGSQTMSSEHVCTCGLIIWYKHGPLAGPALWSVDATGCVDIHSCIDSAAGKPHQDTRRSWDQLALQNGPNIEKSVYKNELKVL